MQVQTRAVSKGLLATGPDDYMSVIGYQTPANLQNDARELLSAYFIVNFHLIDEKHGIVDAQSIMVTVRSGGSSRVRNWIMSDTDGDGLVDKARYLEKNDNDAAASETDVPSDIMPNLQPYFEKTRGLMYSIAEPNEEKCGVSLYTQLDTLGDHLTGHK